KGGGAAGLRPGDVITAVDGAALTTSSDRGYAAHFESLLDATRPEAAMTVSLLRRASPDAEPTKLDFEAQLSRPPMAVIHPEHFDFLDATTHLQPYSYLTTISQIGAKSVSRLGTSGLDEEIAGLPSLRSGTWELLPTDDPDEAAFRFVLDEAALGRINQTGRVEVIKRFRLAKEAPPETPPADARPAYHLTMTVEVKNAGAEPVQISLQQDGPTGLPLEGWWYIRKGSPDFGAAGMRDIVWKATDVPVKLHRNAVIVANTENSKPNLLDVEGHPTVQYVGVDSPYFLAAMIPAADAPGYTADDYHFQESRALVVSQMEKKRRQTTGITYRLNTFVESVAPGQSLRRQYDVFLGPKEPRLLEQYGLEDTIIFGWPVFSHVARFLVGVLSLLSVVVRNYGIAIILLTIMVRTAVLPIGRKQAHNAAKMQELAPELKALSDKYKDDMQGRAQAQQELFRRHNYNPLAGCWMMFLQLPIFIGLYKALSVSIELRQASLIPGLRWCSNLAGPDMFVYWKDYLPAFLADFSGYLGPYLNVLPLVTIGLFIVHQKLFTPPATDEQAEMTQKMMSYMMIFMGFLFFKVPSGLCLYFITSSLWGIGERTLLPKPKPKSLELLKDKKQTKPPSTLSKLMAMLPGAADANGNGGPPPRPKRKKKKR
ncbi:MAG: YidC/Oxa1 family insertase periplasmic-domain containing protein, partial [Planctomycetales bacterium]|nr:YidC/Oxa1 family insertase periplasmic-domain containing protein [Planctomycetales bacterium]